MPKNETRAKFERNFDLEGFYANLDLAPSLAEEAFYHQIIMGQLLVNYIHEDPIYASVERRAREMFVAASAKLIECNPSDAGRILDAQVDARAALKILAIFNEIVEEAANARKAKKINDDLEEENP